MACGGLRALVEEERVSTSQSRGKAEGRPRVGEEQRLPGGRA